MKICVYTIALNEEKFAQRFMDSMKEADGVYVLDTGSTDNTVEILRANGAVVNIGVYRPWRFDIPRNASLAFVPMDCDIAVCVDLDEVLTPGWTQAIRDAWVPGTDRLRYPYIWNTLEDGRDGTTFWYEKMHDRHKFRWVKPVHEILQYLGEGTEKQVYCDKLTLRHLPDNTKSRSNYLPLLKLAVEEEPNDDRSSHYLGREYYFYRQYPEAINELQRHLSLASARWDAERGASMRYISRCYVALGDLGQAERWGLKACAEAPAEREVWYDLGMVYYHQHDFISCYYAMTKCIAIAEKPMSYICDPECWQGMPYDYAALAAYNQQMYEKALALGEVAASLEPNNKQIQENINWYRAKVK